MGLTISITGGGVYVGRSLWRVRGIAARGSGVFLRRSGVVLLRRAPQPLAGGYGLAWHGVVFAGGDSGGDGGAVILPCV